MSDPKAFIEALAKEIAQALRSGAPELRNHRLGAVAVEAAPWHQAMCLSILIETDEYRKWDMGDWEYQDFAELGMSAVIQKGYHDLMDPNLEGSGAYLLFFQSCAQALCHASVRESLQVFERESDFELFVADPDDPNQANLCEEILGVAKKKRKKKTEIVDNLEEAVKDPESVLVLKHWSQPELTSADEKRISKLINLESLHLSYLGLQELPACVRSLRRLTDLHLDGNHLVRLTGLQSLTSLRHLSLLDNNVLTPEMANEISEVQWLRRLTVARCGLTEVPDSWRRLQLLEEVILLENPIALVPEWVFALPNLRFLVMPTRADEHVKAHLRERYPSLEVL